MAFASAIAGFPANSIRDDAQSAKEPGLARAQAGPERPDNFKVVVPIDSPVDSDMDGIPDSEDLCPTIPDPNCGAPG